MSEDAEGNDPSKKRKEAAPPSSSIGSDARDAMVALIKECWSEKWADRPTFQEIVKRLKEIQQRNQIWRRSLERVQKAQAKANDLLMSMPKPPSNGRRLQGGTQVKAKRRGSMPSALIEGPST